MNLVELIFLAIALGIDCIIVSFSQGLIFKTNKRKNSFCLALTMGLFQGLMPIIGYLGTNKLYNFLVPFSKWIVFGIFFILGTKFILEAFEQEKEEVACIGFRCLIGLGIATSIDALVSGISIRLTDTSLLLACYIIGLASFFMSIIGYVSGNRIKHLSSKVLEISGGLILIALAIKPFFFK